MTNEEIKAEMEARHMSITELARKLDITADGLGRILAGKRPMTGQLSRHIELLLEKERDCMFLYKIELPEAKVTELCGRATCQTEEDRLTAIDAIIRHNLAELIELGRKCQWSEAEREALHLEQSEQE